MPPSWDAFSGTQSLGLLETLHRASHPVQGGEIRLAGGVTLELTLTGDDPDEEGGGDGLGKL